MSKKKEEKNKVEIEGSYKDTITYRCPKRGMVTEEVVVTRIAAQKAPEKTIVDSEISELLDSDIFVDIDDED